MDSFIFHDDGNFSIISYKNKALYFISPEDAKAIGISRQEACDLMKQYLPQDNMQKHSLATEAVMRALAEKLGFRFERYDNLYVVNGPIPA